MVYEWKGNPLHDADPNEVGQAIERAAPPGGVPDAADIVDEARPETSVLHPLIFDRPVDEITEVYYRSKARQLQAQLVEVVMTDHGTVRRPAFYHVNYQRLKSNGDNPEVETIRGYQPVRYVLAEPAATQSAAEYLLKKLRGYQPRADALGDLFAPVWAALDQVEAEIRKDEEEEDLFDPDDFDDE